MSYTRNISLDLGDEFTGMEADLRGQLYDNTGATVGSEFSGGFTEMPGGQGQYILRTPIPDGHDGWCRVYPDGMDTTTAGYFAINPNDMEIKALAVEALATDTYAQLTGALSATPTLAEILTWIGMLARNKMIQTTSDETLYADDGATVVAASSTTDVSSVTTRGEWS